MTLTHNLTRNLNLTAPGRAPDRTPELGPDITHPPFSLGRPFYHHLATGESHWFPVLSRDRVKASAKKKQRDVSLAETTISSLDDASPRRDDEQRQESDGGVQDEAPRKGHGKGQAQSQGRGRKQDQDQGQGQDQGRSPRQGKAQEGPSQTQARAQAQAQAQGKRQGQDQGPSSEQSKGRNQDQHQGQDETAFFSPEAASLSDCVLSPEDSLVGVRACVRVVRTCAHICV